MKHKKSLFITTVMMVVLLVAALSTATYAWYTSSNTVNTVATEVNSASSTGANISIGWSQSTPVGTSTMTFDDVPDSTTFHPMVPLKEDETFAFTDDTPFYTAVISYGNLSNHQEATPYIGRNPEGGSSVFYVINYARVATNVTFSANVTGENAARLRLAVFKSDTGELVFTNAGYYTGSIVPTVEKSYTLLEDEPADWADNFGKYSISDGEDNYVQPVAPEFQKNMYYPRGGGSGPADAFQDKPGDWESKYYEYSSTYGYQTDVLGVAPKWEDVGDVYRINPEVPEYMVTSTSVVSPTAPQVPIAASADGVTGVAQGFIVKAWFDGPTQVDAYGGMPAKFALRVEASNVTP
jgi:hypothetical protein